MRLILLLVAFVMLAAAQPLAPARAEEPAPAPAAEESVEALVRRAVGVGTREDESAIAKVLGLPSAEVVPALRKALGANEDFHERITLGYMLAAHGERVGLEVLVASLAQMGHFGYIYLRRVAPSDLGWDPDGVGLARWQAWLAKVTETGYREQVRRSRLPLEVRAAGNDAFTDILEAWARGAARATVLADLRGLAAKFPDADVLSRAADLAEALEQDLKAEATWKEPPSPPKEGDPQRLPWLVYHLRDLRGVKRYSNGYTTILPPPRKGEPAPDTPATAFVAMGHDAVPILLGLLEDRRPIRAFGRVGVQMGPRWWSSQAFVLRVQDAALEILNALLPTPTYERTCPTAYLSAAEPADGAALIADVREWAKASTTGPDARWHGLRRASIDDAVAELRRLATQGERERVLVELRRMIQERSWLHRPLIVELMAELGDRSHVEEVIRTLEDGRYTSHGYMLDGDSAVGLKAAQAAERVRTNYGMRAAPEVGPAQPK